jgi:hypothetical protein
MTADDSRRLHGGGADLEEIVAVLRLLPGVFDHQLNEAENDRQMIAERVHIFRGQRESFGGGHECGDYAHVQPRRTVGGTRRGCQTNPYNSAVAAQPC